MAAKKGKTSLTAMEEFELESMIRQQVGKAKLATEKSGIEKGINLSENPKMDAQPTTATQNEKEKTLKRKFMAEESPKKQLGRPKKNPYAEEKKLTIRMPENLHRQLRFASADTGKPMVEIAVDALIRYLVEYEQN